jgi:hypothetical protein
MSTDAPRRLLALLDDAVPAGPLIELSSTLAQHWRRPLEVVYVESAAALVAAAFPLARVLGPGGAQWLPVAPDDIERGYRSQAARLRVLIERVAGRNAIQCSLRVVRGALRQAALELQPHSDLTLVGGGAAARLLAAATDRRPRPGRPVRRTVELIADRSAAGLLTRQVALEVAQALQGTLIERDVPGTADVIGSALHCELLVLPRALAEPGLLERLGRPALLVG